jgi:16S rRNA (cytosine967-C5)-methyltransferase
MAFTALWRVEAQDAFAEIVLDELFRKLRPGDKDKALAMEITYGVLRWRRLLEFYLKQASDRPLKKIERKALIALRIGAYQVMMLDRVPDSAAVNESVGLAPDKARGFVNAVLRSLAAMKLRLEVPENIKDDVERLSVTWSHPRWMVEEWIERFGYESAEALCVADNQRPRLTLRVNAMRTGREAFLRMLNREGVEASPGRWSPLAVVLEERTPVRDVPGFDDGLFAVQDEASQLAPMVLAPRPGELILDACAAPGTKSLQIMQMMNGRGRVVAVDVHEGRLKRISNEALRLGIKNVTRVVADATEKIGFPKRLQGAKFDRVLVDAPCTGLGTIRRRPEIKWNRKPGDAKERGELQRAILENVSKLLKPGGTLVYSTCTFTLEENEQAVAPLLHSGDFTQEDPGKGLENAGSLVEHKMLRTWPQVTGTDGFTIFKLRKK